MIIPRCVIFINGEIPNLTAVSAILQPEDIVVCADGGLRHALALGRVPRILLGDLDSVDPRALAELEQQGMTVRRYPTEKDETDFELALQWALDEGCRSILIVGGLGGRIDHLLANLAMLTDPRLDGVEVRFDDGTVEIFLVCKQAHWTGRAGDLVSLLPIDAEVKGVETTALKYPLRRETLYHWQARGVSNEMLGADAGVRVSQGRLLCIHTRRP